MNDLFTDMLQQGQLILGDGATEIGGRLQQIVERQQTDLQILALAKADGLLNDEEFDAELDRERVIMETELISLEIQGKATIQKAVNAMFNTFKSGLMGNLT